MKIQRDNESKALSHVWKTERPKKYQGHYHHQGAVTILMEAIFPHGVARSWTQLSDFMFTFHFHELEKEMATHASILG